MLITIMTERSLVEWKQSVGVQAFTIADSVILYLGVPRGEKN